MELGDFHSREHTSEVVTETPPFDAPAIKEISDDEIADQISTIASSSMQVHIVFTKWGGAIVDRTATNKVISDSNAVENAALVKKKLLPTSKELKRLETLSNTLRERGVKFCIKTNTRGKYILPTANFDKFMEVMNEAEKEWNDAVDKFMAKYPKQREQARTDLGALYDPTMYPEPDYVRAQFSMDKRVEPLTLSNHDCEFFKNLNDAQISDVRHIIDKQNARTRETANVFIWHTLRTPIDLLLEVLDESNYPTGTPDYRRTNSTVDRPKFKQSKVSNVLDAAAECRRLNVGNDSQISTTITKIEDTLRGVTAEGIKDDMYLRDHLRKALTTITDGMPSQ